MMARTNVAAAAAAAASATGMQALLLMLQLPLQQAMETAKALWVGKCLLAIPAARGSACRNIGSQMYDDMSRFRQHINTPTYERTSVYFWSSPE